MTCLPCVLICYSVPYILRKLPILSYRLSLTHQQPNTHTFVKAPNSHPHKAHGMAIHQPPSTAYAIESCQRLFQITPFS